MNVTLTNSEFATVVAPWIQARLLDAAEVHAADRLGARAGETDADVLLALALAIRAPRHGHTGIDLSEVLQAARRDWQVWLSQAAPSFSPADLSYPEPNWGLDVADWQRRVLASPLVGRSIAANCPLVWARDPAAPSAPPHDRAQPDLLQIHRMASCEAEISQRLLARTEWLTLRADETTRLGDALRALLDPRETHPLQAVAAAVASVARTTIISGGPGTGKTTTIRKMLLALRSLFTDGPPMRVALAAPTGKAAARMREALVQPGGLTITRDDLAWLETLESRTLHKLLGRQWNAPTHASFNADNPLPYDVVIVDEASMIDAVLMRQLLDAVGDSTRLVLLGDHNQLTSVDAGSVLADLTHVGDPQRVGCAQQQAQCIAELLGPTWPAAPVAVKPHPLAAAMVRFTEAFRFKNDALRKAIYALADASNAPTPAETAQHLATGLDLLERPAVQSGLHRHQHVEQDSFVAPDVLEEIAAAYARVLAPLSHARPATQSQTEPDDLALQTLRDIDQLRVLTGHRDGALGVTGLNAELVKRIQDKLHTPANLRGKPWWPGRLVLVTQNDYENGLWNGDLGIVVNGPRQGAFQVLFADGEQTRRIGVTAMPPHETAFAMTIHKSQGSQFDHAYVVLPQQETRLMTRELIYTGISRARLQLTVCGPTKVLDAALKQRVQRATGLAIRLWQSSN